MPYTRNQHNSYGIGIDRIELTGLPEEEIAIQLGSATLMSLNTTLDRLASEVRQRSADVPAGVVARSQGEMQLRGLDQRRGLHEFEQMEVSPSGAGNLVRLGDIATIEKRPKAGQSFLSRDGKPAIELFLYRESDSDAMQLAHALNSWLEQVRPELPQGIDIHVYQEVWVLLRQQLSVIFENGYTGLILVIITLFLFLNGRVGWWVMIGIPVSFLFATFLYYGLFEGSINILALITFIMALGIVVDDAIVVGEDAVSLHEQGYSPQEAASGAARRMFLPVVTSSLTTLAAFVPLLIAGGEVGAIIQTMPMVLFCVIVASLVECFVVLPRHLKTSFEKMDRDKPGRFRTVFDRQFLRFRDRFYRPLLDKAIAWPGATLWISLGCVILAGSLVVSGRVGMNMVVGMSLEMLEANVAFNREASEQDRQRFMAELEASLKEADQQLGGGNINGYVLRYHTALLNQEPQSGAQYGSLRVEYAWEDEYKATPQEFVSLWQQLLVPPPYVEQLALEVRGGANGGQPDINLVLRGDDIEVLKQASEELQTVLANYEGVTSVTDNLPYGRDQVIFTLTPQGKALGLTTAAVGQQLRAAYFGSRVQIFNHDSSEVEVVLTLPDAERDHIASLNQFPIQTPAGATVPLGQLAELSTRRGIDLINHNAGYLSVMVSAIVDSSQNNAERILSSINSGALPEIRQKYGLTSDLGGSNLMNQQILQAMELGAMLTLVFIYLILCWSFSSYLWPLAVLTAIPLGLTGAIAGHWFMGVDIGVMSLLAFFALTGIVVNDSIVLVSFFRRELAAGKSLEEAIKAAALARFRAVLLTSLTTIAGLAPLMFETFSLAVYMVPIAITLCFGLAFATLLVLLLIPALIILMERGRSLLLRLWNEELLIEQSLSINTER